MSPVVILVILVAMLLAMLPVWRLHLPPSPCPTAMFETADPCPTAQCKNLLPTGLRWP